MRSRKSLCVSLSLVLAFFLFSSVRAAAAPAPITLSPSNVNFGNETIGMTSGASSVSLTNHLSDTVTFSMNISTDFSASDNCAETIAPGQTCAIKVYFTPRVVGNETGSLDFLIIYRSGVDLAASASLSGTGTTSGLKSITITPSNPSVALGLPLQFTAWGDYNNGTVANFTTMVAWSSTSPGVATVSNGSGTQGGVHTVAPGVTTVSATVGSVYGSTTLTVTPPVVESISLAPLNPSVGLGATQQFSATGTYTDGTTRNITSTATWSSSAPTIATISAGLATSLTQGKTTIVVSAGPLGASASTLLTVGPPTLVSMVVTPSTAKIVLAIGSQTQQFTATGTFTDGSQENVSSTVDWASSNTKIATVSSGLVTVTGGETGTSTISATSGSIHASATLAVAQVTQINLQPTSVGVPVGETAQIYATAVLSDGSVLEVEKDATWTSSDPSIATVSQGLVTGVTPSNSTVTITATVGYQNQFPKAVSASATVFVGPAVLTGISLTPSSSSVRTGTSEQLDAVGTYSDGTQQYVTSQASWTSSDSTVATAAPDGVVGGVAPGTATITALVTGPNLPSGGVSGSATVAVSGQVVSIIVSPSSATIPLGDTEKFAATGTYSDGTTASLTAATWSSSNTAVATAAAGLATSVGQGSAKIVATVGSTSAGATLTVAPPALASIQITPAHPSILSGTTQQLTATGVYTDKSTEDLTGSVTWSSSNNAVASVASGGLTTAGAVGATKISATSGSVSASMPLGVYASGQARFAYAISAVDQKLDLYLVDNSSGTLVIAESMDFPGSYPSSIASDPQGQHLYVGDRSIYSSELYGYTINQVTGSLDPIAGMPIYVPNLWSLAVDPSGRLLLTANGGSVESYSLDASGFPTLVSSNAANSPTDVTIDPAGKYAYAANVNGNSISVYSLDDSSGLATKISGSPFPVPGPNPQTTTVYPLGGYLFVANGNGQSISVFSLDSTTGALVGSPTNYTVGQIPLNVAVDPAGKFAYVANNGSRTISAFSVDSATGVLTPVQGSPFTVAGLNLSSYLEPVTVDPTGRFLYGLNSFSNQIFVFSIDPTTGVLTQLPTVTNSAGPNGITLVK